MSKWRAAGLYLVVIIGLMLAGCGGGGGGGAQTISGVAASGALLSGTVHLKDSSKPAKELAAPVATDGSFSFDVSGLAPPFLLKADGTANGNNFALYSVATTVGVANINPLSHLAVVLANGSDDLASLYATPDPAKMQSIINTLANTITKLQTVFQPTLFQFGVENINFISDSYVANHQGLDLMFDLIAISVSNGTVTITDKTDNRTFNTPLSVFLTASINLNSEVPAKPAGSVCVIPNVSSVAAYGTVNFTAIVIGTSIQQISWSVVEANGGTITSAGVYTAPATSGTYHVKATNAADETKSATATVTVTARVFGVAAKGPISNGPVRIFALNSNGSVGTLLKTTKTNVFGQYTSRVMLTGPFMVEASGQYTDEATGSVLSIASNSPLHAAVDSVSSVMEIAVTPMTELAVQKAKPLLVGENISSANALVSDIFKVDIIATRPVEPSASVFLSAATSQAQKDYSLALAAISQMVKDYYGGSITGALTDMGNDIIRGNALTIDTATKFKSALITFINSDKNQTGIRDINLTNMANVGGSAKIVKIRTSGTLESGKSICGIILTVRLPANVTVRADFIANVYEPLHGVVYASGVTPHGAMVTSNYTPISGSAAASLTIKLADPSGFGLGEFVTLKCDVPVGQTVNATDFVLSGFKAFDADGVVLQNVTGQIN